MCFILVDARALHLLLMYTKGGKQTDAVSGRPVPEQIVVVFSVIFKEETNYVDLKKGWKFRITKAICM